MPVDTAHVAELVTQSMRRHKAAMPVRRPGQPDRPRDMVAAREHWTEARRLRMEAHALDPEHESDAWRHGPSDTDIHAEMLEFYAQHGVTD